MAAPPVEVEEDDAEAFDPVPVAELPDEVPDSLAEAPLVEVAWAEDEAPELTGDIGGTWTGMLVTPAGREAAGCWEVTTAG